MEMETYLAWFTPPGPTMVFAKLLCKTVSGIESSLLSISMITPMRPVEVKKT